MNKLSTAKRAKLVRLLVEGMSMRAICRTEEISRNTLAKLQLDLGEACLKYQDEHLADLPCTRIECDEIWAFCHQKERTVAPENKGHLGYGDIWTWTALCADTKLIVNFHVGRRTELDAKTFIRDLASRLANRIQLSTDGYRMYFDAVEHAFGYDGIDYAMITKIYGNTQEAAGRYSPACCTGTERKDVFGNPDPAKVCTSYVERQNLTLRMSQRRFTRLTNGFSKKAVNHMAAVSLHYLYYNFARPHKTLTKANKGYPTTPAMAAGIADHVWTMEEIVGLLDAEA